MLKVQLGKKIQKELIALANPQKAIQLMRFFKCGPGQYGAGDIFIGLTVPEIRNIAKIYFKQVNFESIEFLMTSIYHEVRLTALLILTYRIAKAVDESARQQIVEFYIKHIDYVNNWDLVDLSADKILGEYLYDKDRAMLYDFARSNHLWKERISIISTYNFIKKGDYRDTLSIAAILLNHKHDLIHKAVGWMLREIGKRELNTGLFFLNKYYKAMPRTMLRYAIEKFDESLRLKYLKGEIN